MRYKNCPSGCGEPNAEDCKGCYAWEVEHNSSKKQHIGIEPHEFWIETRINSILDAVNRYIESKCEIPVEWIMEYNDLRRELNRSQDQSITSLTVKARILPLL